jgi:hemolysin D
MPYPSFETSPGTAQEVSSDYQNRHPEPSIVNPVQQPAELADIDKDLYHGTEELLDTLPRVWTRGLLYTLLGFVVLVIPWSIYAKIDETGTARGRIEPKGATQKLDTEVGGTVKAVKVKLC